MSAENAPIIIGRPFYCYQNCLSSQILSLIPHKFRCFLHNLYSVLRNLCSAHNTPFINFVIAFYGLFCSVIYIL